MPTTPVHPDLLGFGAAHTHTRTCYWEVHRCRWSCAEVPVGEPQADDPTTAAPATPAPGAAALRGAAPR